MRRLTEQWLTTYDWRRWEERLNSYPQFVTEIDGQTVHFLHVRSADPDAIPLVLTHGWPNTFLEYVDLIEPLTAPANGEQAFHLVIPSIPGFGFSGPTHEKGWNRYRTAAAWAELMRRLGYERYGAHGNDGGSYVSPEVGRIDPEHVIGVHVTQLFSFPSGDPAELENLTEEEQGYLQFLQFFNDNMGGYAKLQEQTPQNVAHALADSPTGQLAWVAQLLSGCSDEHVLTNATIYWLTNTGASSARLLLRGQARRAPEGADHRSDRAGQLRVRLPAAAPVRRARPREHRVLARVRPRQPLGDTGRAGSAAAGPPGVLRRAEDLISGGSRKALSSALRASPGRASAGRSVRACAVWRIWSR